MVQDQMGSESGDSLSEGYCIKVEVLPDGFKVSDPLPIDHEYETDQENADEPDESDDTIIPDLATALKNVMQVINQNPVGQSEQMGFDATAQ